MSEARRLAQTKEEKQSVADIDAKIMRADRQLQEQQDAAISKNLAVFRQRLKDCESANQENAGKSTSALSKLASDIDSTKNQFTKASPAMLSQLDPLIARIRAIRQSAEKEKQQREAKAKLTSSVGNAAAYDDALEEFAKRFPDSEIAANLAVLKQESQLWQGFAEWNGLMSALRSESEPLTSKRAREFIADGEKLSKKYPSLQLADQFRLRKGYLESIANREPENGPQVIAELQKLFRDPLVGNLWMVETNNNDLLRFYSRHEPVKESGMVRFNYLAGFNLEEKAQSARESDVSYLGRAPQSTLAEHANALLSSMSPRDWEKNFTLILDSILKEERLDPLLKISLLQRVLKTGIAGSSALGDGFADYRRELEGTTVDLSVSWMNPRDSAAKVERNRAEVFIGGLPPISDAIRAAAVNVRHLREPLEFSYHWIGWLSRDANNAWTAVTAEPASETGDLIIVCKSSGDASAAPVVIGELDKGVVHVA